MNNVKKIMLYISAVLFIFLLTSCGHSYSARPSERAIMDNEIDNSIAAVNVYLKVCPSMECKCFVANQTQKGLRLALIKAIQNIDKLLNRTYTTESYFDFGKYRRTRTELYNILTALDRC